jgi:hypothetical protein
MLQHDQHSAFAEIEMSRHRNEGVLTEPVAFASAAVRHDPMLHTAFRLRGNRNDAWNFGSQWRHLNWFMCDDRSMMESRTGSVKQSSRSWPQHPKQGATP